MHKIPFKLQALAALSLLMPCFADAAGLGKLTVTSALGQPLSAKIELVSVSREELNSLAARLATPDAYRNANLQYPQALSSVRFAVEQQPGGQPYIKVTSTRPINEPVVDLLVELAWANGRISRAYTALIDPPGYDQQRQVAGDTAAAPGEASAAAPIAPPVTAAEAARPSMPIRTPPARVQAPAADQYGPIKRGETLTGVAASVKPEGVTLEQMLVALYRSNPDAFIDNMNRMKAGKILRVPDREKVAAVTPGEAQKEVRVQASDWNNYRRRLADAAATAQEGSATSGRITARVEDNAAASPSRDVVRLSKGEGPGAVGGTDRAGGASAADRLRALEEENVAREKALAEANDRIAQLEKTIREQQRLLELKGAPLGTQQPASKPEAKPATTAPVAPAPAAETSQVAPPPAAAPAPSAAQPAAATPAPQAQPKPKVVPPPPATSTDVMDVLFEEPLYLGAAGGLIVFAGLAYVLARRRRTAPATTDPLEPVAPMFAGPPAAKAEPRPLGFETETTQSGGGSDIAPGEEVDALAEAEVYIAYGRDSQAEEILKEALTKNPTRQDVQLKLLEIYAARKDRAAFNEVASRLHRQTGGQGDAWARAATMGRALDESNSLYAGAAAGAAATADMMDLDLGTPPSAEPARASAASPGAKAPSEIPEPAAPVAVAPVESAPISDAPVEALAPEFTLEIPPTAAPATADVTPAPATTDSNVIDFKLDLPEVGATQTTAAPAAAPAPAASAPVADAGLDFKLDFGDINLNLEGETPAPAAGGSKDPHWHDVQQKFDLAKAYEEMGDKEGAREVLQEVLGEGDPDQQAQAKKLLETLA
ncbi:MAG: FimV/HubP family polar landmark protein [Rhodospirillaceae bacterium]